MLLLYWSDIDLQVPCSVAAVRERTEALEAAVLRCKITILFRLHKIQTLWYTVQCGNPLSPHHTNHLILWSYKCCAPTEYTYANMQETLSECFIQFLETDQEIDQCHLYLIRKTHCSKTDCNYSQ